MFSDQRYANAVTPVPRSVSNTVTLMRSASSGIARPTPEEDRTRRTTRVSPPWRQSCPPRSPSLLTGRPARSMATVAARLSRARCVGLVLRARDPHPQGPPKCSRNPWVLGRPDATAVATDEHSVVREVGSRYFAARTDAPDPESCGRNALRPTMAIMSASAGPRTTSPRPTTMS